MLLHARDRLTPQMWEQARTGGYHSSSVFGKIGLDLSSITRHVAMTATLQEDSDIHQADTAHGLTDVSRTIWHTEFIGDLVLVNCCPFEGGDVGQSMHWHTACVMRMMFRSWSLTVQILVRERLEARCEELKSQTGNRPPITPSTL